jgi:hypothetical protein
LDFKSLMLPMGIPLRCRRLSHQRRERRDHLLPDSESAGDLEHSGTFRRAPGGPEGATHDYWSQPGPRPVTNTTRRSVEMMHRLAVADPFFEICTDPEAAAKHPSPITDMVT